MGRKPWWGILLLCAWSTVDAAVAPPVYRWTDAAGVVHYADHPGVPGATMLRTDGALLSVVESGVRSRKTALSPFVQDELRWQQQGREAQRREAEREINDKLRRCAALRTQLAAATEARARERALALERKWFDSCR